MPSHFHSISHASGLPSVSGASSSGEARQNGYGRDRSSSVRSWDSTDENQSADGVHSPISRAAIVVAGKLGRLCDGAHHERLRNANAELPREQLEQHETLKSIEPPPPLGDTRLLQLWRQRLQRDDAILHPARQRKIL